MVGLPEDNWARVAATVCTALALPLHAAQFNVYSPLPGESFGTDHTVGVDDFVPNGNNYRYRTCRAMTAMEVRRAAALAGQAFARTAPGTRPGRHRWTGSRPGPAGLSSGGFTNWHPSRCGLPHARPGPNPPARVSRWRPRPRWQCLTVCPAAPGQA